MKFTGKFDKQGNPLVEKYGVEFSYIDMRASEDIAAESLGLSKESFGEEVDALFEELLLIARTIGFLKPCRSDYEPGEAYEGKEYPEFSPETFDSRNHHVRAREIGKILNEIAGFRLMQVACARVSSEVKYQSRALEFCWDGIGQWLA